jgi:tetratricopeptide (TPR) repeat protein
MPDDPSVLPTVQLVRGWSASDQLLLQQLAQRLVAADAECWVRGLAAAGPDAALPSLDRMVRRALRLAERIVAGGEPESDLGELTLPVAIWSLLRARLPAVGAVVAAALAQHGSAPSPSAPTPLPLLQLGHYDMLYALGEGASGAVFAARHRLHGGLAAVKILRHAARTPEQVLRFRRESQLTAQLDHPSIVRVLGAGVEQAERMATPYIAYELVVGKPFAQALAGKPWQAVVAAFLGVGEAIAYAHGRGILHRDLKSANVLVDAAGRPHVLDFGIARLAAIDDLRLTAAGAVLGSPAAMSPEQAAARPVDARSDVYSLGVLLFEALAGELPHQFRGLGAAQAVVVVASTPIRSLAAVAPQLPADLIAIVDHATAFAAADRYPSVHALLADVQRLLHGQSVSVTRPGAWESLCLLAHRHRQAAAMVALSAVACLVTASALFVAWRQSAAKVAAEAASARTAQQAAEGSRAALRLLVQATRPLVESSPVRGEYYEHHTELLHRALAHAEAGVTDAADPDSTQLLASLHELAGDLAFRGGQPDAAAQHREAAVALWQRVATARPEFELDHALALVKFGDLAQEHRLDEACDCYRRAHAVFAAAAAAADASVVARDELGWSYERLGAVAWATGRRPETFELARQRLQLAERLLVEQPDATRQFQLASALAHLVVYSREEPALAGCGLQQLRPLAARAAAAAEAARCEHPSRRAYLDLAIRTQNYLAQIVRGLGEPAAALGPAERAAELADESVRQDPLHEANLLLAIWAHADLATLVVELGDPLRGEHELRHAARLGERALANGPLPGLAAEHTARFLAAAAALRAGRAMPELAGR